jgi:hypothetical protein
VGAWCAGDCQDAVKKQVLPLRIPQKAARNSPVGKTNFSLAVVGTKTLGKDTRTSRSARYRMVIPEVIPGLVTRLVLETLQTWQGRSWRGWNRAGDRDRSKVRSREQGSMFFELGVALDVSA